MYIYIKSVSCPLKYVIESHLSNLRSEAAADPSGPYDAPLHCTAAVSAVCRGQNGGADALSPGDGSAASLAMSQRTHWEC